MVNSLIAQLPYVLDTRNETFQYLPNATVLTGPGNAPVSVPFSFVISGPSLTNGNVNTSCDGYLNFGSWGIVSFVGKMGYLINCKQ